ncbi:phosphoglycerate mutase-like protein [Thelephora ganbajun]|uniref:Phosphoglycerate mutase-like protein n=1 Tax=Thelephora ganbajun TaxID=370292 RepID=A0ACB6ZR74_THEGA|nr:phosphoglycerate mutase-like protein [Thelephora ganbajun]
MIEKIYIVRHGFRLNWVNTNWTSPTGLPRDPPLAAHGEAEAKEFAQHILSLPEEEKPTAIFSSPYYRCLQTSQPAAQALKLPLYVEHGLSEWYSPVALGTGLHPRPASTSSLKRWFQEIDPAGWSTTWYPSRRGEGVEEIHDRADGYLSVFIPHVERVYPQHKVIMLVSHAGPIIAFARSLVGDRNLPIRVGCCSLTEFVRKQGEDWKVIGGWEAKKLADGAHLKNGASREWGFEDIEIANGKVVEDKGEANFSGEEDQPVGSQVPDTLVSISIPTRM